MRINPELESLLARMGSCMLAISLAGEDCIKDDAEKILNNLVQEANEKFPGWENIIG